MAKFYFFKSSRKNDEITSLSVFTTSIEKAYFLAARCFLQNNCKGRPQMLAI